MDIGMVGLGKMGGNMARRLQRGGHRVVGFDPGAAGVGAEADGPERVDSLQALVQALPVPRVVWMMVPAGAPVDATLDVLLPLLQPGDVLVDGGNSNYRDSERRAARCRQTGVQLLDCGTSGGVWGLERGFRVSSSFGFRRHPIAGLEARVGEAHSLEKGRLCLAGDGQPFLIGRHCKPCRRHFCDQRRLGCPPVLLNRKELLLSGIGQVLDAAEQVQLPG